jgi:uncharacterized membrane protein
MDLVSCAVSFFLGGVTAVIIMGLLVLFIDKPSGKNQDKQYLKQIADSLLRLTDLKKA